jgi:hypothetical protein
MSLWKEGRLNSQIDFTNIHHERPRAKFGVECNRQSSHLTTHKVDNKSRIGLKANVVPITLATKHHVWEIITAATLFKRLFQ